MAETELSVVCKSCGSEVSPYVTECPYCGTRLRRRAPKLEREGGEIRVREGRREKRRKRAAQRRERRLAAEPWLAAERPWVTIAAILGPAIALIVQRAADLSLYQLGAIQATGADWWQYFAAPFVYQDIGYLFVVALAIAIFVPELERRLGTVAALMLVVACGALGALAAPGLDQAFGDGFTNAAGGNGIALGVIGAWVALRWSAVRDDPTEEYDWIPVAVAAAVVALLPLVEDFANPWAGVVGGVVGLASGYSATLGRR